MELDPKIIKASFEGVKPLGPEIINKFFGLLWKRAPELKGFFGNTNMEVLKDAFLQTLCYIVEHMEEPEELKRYLGDLGARHVMYGAQEKHYALVGDALLRAFKESLKDRWTPELEKQWSMVFKTIIQLMLAGAKQVNQGKIAA